MSLFGNGAELEKVSEIRDSAVKAGCLSCHIPAVYTLNCYVQEFLLKSIVNGYIDFNLYLICQQTLDSDFEGKAFIDSTSMRRFSGAVKRGRL